MNTLVAKLVFEGVGFDFLKKVSSAKEVIQFLIEEVPAVIGCECLSDLGKIFGESCKARFEKIATASAELADEIAFDNIAFRVKFAADDNFCRVINADIIKLFACPESEEENGKGYDKSGEEHVLSKSC